VSTLEIHVGVDLAREAHSIKDALRRHEAGEAVHHGARITFESWEGLTKVLTSKRLEILRHLHRNPEASIRSLSKSLGRDYKNVHEDVTALISAGLIDDHDGLRAEYDAIEMKMAL
jgi:predicted transcriptional regulator